MSFCHFGPLMVTLVNDIYTIIQTIRLIIFSAVKFVNDIWKRFRLSNFKQNKCPCEDTQHLLNIMQLYTNYVVSSKVLYCYCYKSYLFNWVHISFVLFLTGVLGLKLPYLALLNLDSTCVSGDIGTQLAPTCPVLKVVRTNNLRPAREAEDE